MNTNIDKEIQEISDRMVQHLLKTRKEGAAHYKRNWEELMEELAQLKGSSWKEMTKQEQDDFATQINLEFESFCELVSQKV